MHIRNQNCPVLKTNRWRKKRILLLNDASRLHFGNKLGRLIPKSAHPVMSHDPVREVLGLKYLVNGLVGIQVMREQ